jgi:hypothetical protein
MICLVKAQTLLEEARDTRARPDSDLFVTYSECIRAIATIMELIQNEYDH